MSNFNDIESTLESLAENNNLRVLSTGEVDGIHFINEGKRVLNLSSNDYLGIASDNSLSQKFFEEFRYSGSPFTSSSSRLLTGNHPFYQQLEDSLLNVFPHEKVILYSSGYHANTGILPALFGPDDLILSDKLVHASLIDGIRLSTAKSVRWRHLDYNHLEKLIQQNKPKGKMVIVCESVYSMDGDCCDLKTLIALKERYDAILYLDEAHAVGAMGKRGLGLAEQEGLLDKVDILVGTFGKAYASQGAFALTSETLYKALVNRSRTLIFTTALPPISLAWTKKTFELSLSKEKERLHLQSISEKLREGVKSLGYQTAGITHIVPQIIGENRETIQLSQKLFEKGFLAMPIRHPSVPLGTARIRFSLSAALSVTHIENLLTAIKAL